MGQEIRSLALLDGKFSLLQGTSLFALKAIKDEKYRLATRKDADIDISSKVVQ